MKYYCMWVIPWCECKVGSGVLSSIFSEKTIPTLRLHFSFTSVDPYVRVNRISDVKWVNTKCYSKSARGVWPYIPSG